MADGSGLVRQDGVLRQRSVGRIAVRVARLGGTSRIAGLAESGPLRLRLPTIRDGPPEGVIVNTAGGLACGDDMAVAANVGAGAALVLATASAEKVYRSTGPTTRIATRLTVEAEGRVEWLPQETIAYDRIRLARSLAVELDVTATALLFEATVFGRAAHAETVREGAFEDRWRVARGGRLVYADTFRLRSGIADALGRPTIAGGHRALATLLYVAPDAEARLDEARVHLEGSAGECGASAWNGTLLIRWLAPDVATLRRDALRFMVPFRGGPMPRVWMA